MPSVHVVILAAGLGKRMNSALPKVLHPLGGRPLLEHVVQRAQSLDAAAVHVVYGHGGDEVKSTLAHLPVQWVEQAERLGTGHAVRRAMPNVPDPATVLVLYGDVPLISCETLRRMVALAARDALALLTVELDEPTGYGRILRDPHGAVVGIVEEKDACEAHRGIREINTGIVAAPAGRLRGWLERLGNDNAQGEYYLTDVVELAVADRVTVDAASPATVDEVLGVNDRVRLAYLERVLQRARAERLMLGGATLLDPARVDIRGRVIAGHDVTIDVNVVFEGDVVLGDGVTIGPNTSLRSTDVGPGTAILGHCSIEGARIGGECRIGPFARIRRGTELADRARVGNFVEVKNTRIGAGSKAMHLTYLGDTEVGSMVNVGAGTITCNYDGADKHRTVIGDRAFIGSGVELVAPVTIGPGATIGAGSTIVRDTPGEQLTVARQRQTTVAGWRRPVKKK